VSWEWDETLYAGSAAHYATGRMPYPESLALVLRDHLGLDGTGRLLDVGCGPGSLTLLLAPLFAAAVGVDADPGMIAEARRRSDAVDWRHLRAEQLPAGLGTFRVVTFAQSFHWMDQPVVADRVRTMLEPGGAWVHVFATTHRGVDGDDPLPHPRPPWDDVDALVGRYLGPVRRAGRSTLPHGTRSGEEDVMRAAGYTGPDRIEVTRGEVVTRTADEVVSAVFSLSHAAPHLFGADLGRFEADLRAVLRSAAPDGRFSERLREVGLVVWRPAATVSRC
jgi:SAM-dependent methyltransferase